VTAKETAKSDGKLQAHAEAKFADGTHVAATILRTCTPQS